MIGGGRMQRICFTPLAITSVEITNGVFMKEKVAISVRWFFMARNVLLAYQVTEGRLSIIRAAT